MYTVVQLLPVMLRNQAGGGSTPLASSDAKYALVAMRRTMLAGTETMDAHNSSSLALPARDPRSPT